MFNPTYLYSGVVYMVVRFVKQRVGILSEIFGWIACFISQGGLSNDQIDGGYTGRSSANKFKRVAVVEDFFEIIYNVHVEMDGRGGKHAGQKRTYRAVVYTWLFTEYHFTYLLNNLIK